MCVLCAVLVPVQMEKLEQDLLEAVRGGHFPTQEGQIVLMQWQLMQVRMTVIVLTMTIIKQGEKTRRRTLIACSARARARVCVCVCVLCVARREEERGPLLHV